MELFRFWCMNLNIECEFWNPELPHLGFTDPTTNKYWAGWEARAELIYRGKE